MPLFPIVEEVVTNSYFCNIFCNIIVVVIIYEWHIWYSKRKLKQDYRCNECIESVYDGIEMYNNFASDIPQREDDSENEDYLEKHRRIALKYVDFYEKNKGKIYIANLALSYKGNDLLIESIQSCFFINLNFKLLGIVNHIKNRLPNLREKYPKIEKLYKEYKENGSDEALSMLGDDLPSYFIDVGFMAEYWKSLLDYLGYDPTFIRLYVKTYNSQYKIEEDIKLPYPIRYNRAIEVEKIVRKTMARDFIRNFWKK